MISKNADRRVLASQRQVMQYLRSGDWIIVAKLPIAATAGALNRLADYARSNDEAVARGPRLNSPPSGSRRYRRPSDLDDLPKSSRAAFAFLALAARGLRNISTLGRAKAEGEKQMIKPKRSAEQQVADEADRKALNPVRSRQTISDSQAEPEFQENHKRLKADRLAREAGLKATGKQCRRA